MKKIILVLFAFTLPLLIQAQCTTGNATTCVCADGTSNCDLLPNIEIGHTEFAQTGTFGLVETPGRLLITVSTPNTGHGPLEVRTTNVFVCGTDTFFGTAPTICPDGITYPKIEVNQRVFHKNGNAMTYTDRAAGTMTYHPSHGHMHVDDWGLYTLRQQTPDPNPLNWPIYCLGRKLAFCLEDYGQCSDAQYNGDCLDSLGNVLNLNSQFPNYGLGGGAYNCSPIVQGITSGYVDIYWTTLDGMWIDLPAGICNGNYWLVVNVDPYNYFIEENENDNVYSYPVTLTQQSSTAVAYITSSGGTNLCSGTTMQLTASIGDSYVWSSGDTTASIQITGSGTYTVTVTSQCGVATSSPFTVNVVNSQAPTTTGDSVCVNNSATLTASGTGTINWYDAPTAGNLVYSGNTFTTPTLATTTDYYAENVETLVGATSYSTPHDNTIGGGGYPVTNQYLIFDVMQPCTLVSAKVYANSAGNRTVELRNSSGAVLQSATINIPAGQSQITLNFNIVTGADYQLGVSNNPDLFRNNAGVSYPYIISGLTNIKNSSAGNAYYYWFYDWEVKPQDFLCSSARIQAEAFVDQCQNISSTDAASMTVTPNPANDYLIFTIKNILADNAEIKIFDMAGKLAMKKTINAISSNSKHKIDISTLAKGVYFVELNAGGKQIKEKVTVN